LIPDWNGNARYGFNAKISNQDLRDYYLPSFQACARDAHAQSFMCAYNAVNGIPTCADPWLLGSVLRQHWNWTTTDQWVVSDCDAVANSYEDHHYGSSAADAAAKSLNAGTDLDCGTFYPKNLGTALKQGLINATTLDESQVRRYSSLVRLGYFDPPEKQPYRRLGWKDVGVPAARALALRAATEGLVLLKNRNGTLPLPKSVKTVAVVGPMAGATTQMQGNYYGTAKDVSSPVAGFKKAGYTVMTGGGSSAADIDGADAVVFVGGINNDTEEEEKDRNDITWPVAQLSTIKALATAAATAGKPFVVVQMGTMVDSADLKSNEAVGALLWAGYPGQDGGLAIANIISGVDAPAGRLPITQYPAEYTKAVPMTDMALRPGNGNPG